MGKAGLILSGVDDANSTRLNSGSTMQDGVITINKKIYFRVPDGENPRSYNDLDVYSHEKFPKVYSALTEDPRYKFYGNASISHDWDDGHYFTAELEYSTSNPNATDVDDKAVDSNTPPWKLRPDNISFSYPERQVPFQAAYNSSGKRYNANGQILIPVQNSAGDPFVAQTVEREAEISFSFATKSWDPNNAIYYGSTINSQEISVCGLKIPARRGLLRPPECEFITTYEDSSGNKKWEYWNVRISILITFSDYGFAKKVLDVGDKAHFAALDYKDSLLPGGIILPATTGGASQICSFRKYVITDLGNGYAYAPIGDIVFCSWEQFLAFRQGAINQSIFLTKVVPSYLGGIVDPQCEQHSQMPLDANGYFDKKALKTKQYNTLSFLEYPTKSWSSLNLPKKGVKW